MFMEASFVIVKIWEAFKSPQQGTAQGVTL